MNKEQRLAQRTELQNKVAYAYFLVADGRATVVGYEKEGTCRLHYGIALCAPGDQFSRAQGRKVALAHLIERERGNQNNAFNLAGRLNESSTGMSVTAKLRKALVEHLTAHAGDEEAPKWLREGALEMVLNNCNFEHHIAGPNGKPWMRENKS